MKRPAFSRTAKKLDPLSGLKRDLMKARTSGDKKKIAFAKAALRAAMAQNPPVKASKRVH